MFVYTEDTEDEICCSCLFKSNIAFHSILTIPEGEVPMFFSGHLNNWISKLNFNSDACLR